MTKRPDATTLDSGVTTAALFAGESPAGVTGEGEWDAADMHRYLATMGATIAVAGVASLRARHNAPPGNVYLTQVGNAYVASIPPQTLTVAARRHRVTTSRDANLTAIALQRAVMLATQLRPHRNPVGPRFGVKPLVQFNQATAFLWDKE